MESKDSKALLGSTVNLSKQFLKKIERANNDQKNATILILDDNEIQRLDGLESYINLKKLSLINNQLVRMYGVSQLIHLEILDLTNNSLVTIEGLKDLKNLKELYLGKNKIKIMEHLDNNVNLEKIDISDNNIAHISDISCLKSLKELYLHGNKLTHLRQCEKSFPENIEILTLHNNLICDLNEVSHLMPFNSIKKLTFSGNPCIDFVNNLQQAFNYRPFIKNWCSNLKILDNQPLDDIECLKAEWLYSQGRGRSFRSGEQAALVEYLVSVCPSKEPNDDAEDVKKLKLILSKAQQHQKQLEEQISTGVLTFHDTIKVSKKKKFTALHERMVTSYQDYGQKSHRNSPDLMTRSLDSGISKNSQIIKGYRGEAYQAPLQTSTTFIPIPDTLISPDVCHKGTSFLRSPGKIVSISNRTSKTSSKNSPHSTPESKRKTSLSSVKKSNDHSSQFLLKKQQKLGSSTKKFEFRGNDTSDDEESFAIHKHNSGNVQKQGHKNLNNSFCDGGKIQNRRKDYSAHKKESIKKGDIEIEKFIDSEAWKAAICIQRRWRGYRARNLNRKVLAVCKDIQLLRMQEYITKVISEMEATRIALEDNRKLQVLQMQAINAIWKKMITLQPSEPTANLNGGALNLQEVVEICSNLNKQVEGLQAMIKALQYSSITCQTAPIAIQTEIVAVHTPHGNGEKAFPYTLNSETPEIQNDPTPGNKPTTDDSTFINQEELISTPKSEFTEIYTNKSLGENFSDSELFFVPALEDKQEAECLSLKLPKLLQNQEPIMDFSKSLVEENNSSVMEHLNDSTDVQNKVASKN